MPIASKKATLDRIYKLANQHGIHLARSLKIADYPEDIKVLLGEMVPQMSFVQLQKLDRLLQANTKRQALKQTEGLRLTIASYANAFALKRHAATIQFENALKELRKKINQFSKT